MEVVEASAIRPDSEQSQTNAGVDMLPRPCSMPSFDKKTELARKRILQTLPSKPSVRRGLENKPWKSMSSSQGLFGTASPAFGTPSYPAHLDMIRAPDVGLSTSDISSYSSNELNNNFLDSLIHEARAGICNAVKKEGDLASSKKNLAESLHSFSFAPGFSRGSFAPSPSPGLNSSLNTSWQFFNFVGGAEVGTVFPTTTRNPNKAIITIDGRTSKILVANEIAGKLFGYLNDELCGMKMSKLFTMKDGFKQDALLEQHIDVDGNIVMVSGKVVEAVDCDGCIIPVSLWMKMVHSDGDPRCVAIIEPVQRAVGSFLFNAEGTIVDCDSQFALLHGFSSPEEVVGESILNLIPAFMLPIPGHELARSLKKQRATGKTKDNTRFPVSIQISEYDKESHDLYLRRGHPDDIQFSKFLYKGIVWVFSNISGLISVSPSGRIHSCNGNFSMMLFGYSEQELVGKDLTCLVPFFYDHVELAEDRSLKIPSISDDGEIHLDPKRDTALSGNFAIGTSSVSDGFSDVDSMLGNCEYMNDLKGVAEISQSNSELTGASSLTLESDAQDTDSGLPIKSMNGSSTSESSFLTPRPNGEQFSSTPEIESIKTNAARSRSERGCLVVEEQREPSTLQVVTNELASESSGEIKCLDLEKSKILESTDAPNCSCLSGQDSCNTENTSCHKSCCISENEGVTKAEKELTAKKADSIDSKGNFDSENKCLDAGKDIEANSGKYNADEKSLGQMKDGELDGADDKENLIDEVGKPESVTNKSINNVENQESIIGKTLIDSRVYVLNKGKEETSSEEHSLAHTECRDMPTALKYDSSTFSEPTNSHMSNENTGSRGNAFVNEDGLVVLDAMQEGSKNLEQEPEAGDKVGKVDSSCDKGGWQPNRVTSTPKLDRADSQTTKKIFEGNFCGQARHKDGSLLPIVFQIKQITLDRGQEMFCIWVSRDPEEHGEGSRAPSQMLFTSSFNSTLNTSHGGYLYDAQRTAAELSRSLTEENLKGQYDERYLTLKSIGKGAFGFVKLAQRRLDGQEVVVKFIQKSKIVPSSWIEHKSFGKIPLEVYYLVKIDHPNIVKMFDVFENDEFFQLVMEKHGDGIDLFEFIDRQPALDEPLCAYMFKQVVSAVSYLHSQNILHRDVKDENIIVDKQFTLKLIDFGSAVYMEQGKLFSTFCGTVEYCSPEVLLGNKYRGPELEVWSMGITLYTLVFGENPFFDVEETIKGELHPPFRVSSELMFLVCWMLHTEPNLRASVKDISSYRWLNQKVDVGLYDYDTIFAEDREDYYPGSDDRSPSSAEYDENYVQYDYDEYEEEQEYVAEHERLEEEYIRYLQRQTSLPETYEREHGASF
ncbi:PAS domain-containing serine/threonine-protein kinase-like [Rhopilema esculentum]|uniref:PAS domain-containing serine/threonine-protein kinase-like n=1 Tax=Rhopilema esculentum TaxID=499914 RepID=UPI0031DE99F4|eukprot:gene8312-14276_t